MAKKIVFFGGHKKLRMRTCGPNEDRVKYMLIAHASIIKNGEVMSWRCLLSELEELLELYRKQPTTKDCMPKFHNIEEFLCDIAMKREGVFDIRDSHNTTAIRSLCCGIKIAKMIIEASKVVQEREGGLAVYSLSRHDSWYPDSEQIVAYLLEKGAPNDVKPLVC